MRKLALPVLAILLALWASPLQAYWIWTPLTRKWINPKYAVKDTPKEQLETAMTFYNAKDFEHAINEFKKLVHFYPRSQEAPESLYFLGLSYEATGYYYEAYQAYQKALEEYPHTERFDNMIEREYRLGEAFLGGAKVKLWKFPLYPSYEYSAEIFQKVVENAPFGKWAAQAQYMAGEAYKKAGMYNEASLAFMKVLNNYPQSDAIEKAKFQVAYCALKASPAPGYDDQTTEKAIEEYRSFIKEHSESEFIPEAKDALSILLEKKAENDYLIAEFYERQGKLEAAEVYYRDILLNYPDTTWAGKAKEKLDQIRAALGE
ncbi:MAG: outer membrane protein assembly factor BamD [Candidatus Omnitrophota bacterium]